MKRSILYILLFCLLGLAAQAQTRVRGVVTDAQTGEPLPYVSVVFPGTQIGTMTDPRRPFLHRGQRQLFQREFHDVRL